MNGEWGLRTGPGRCFPVFPKVDTPYGQALTGLKVQAPLGARVLSFVCCAPNDGFSPQSGLVQRGILYAAAWGSENHTTALRALEMHSPFGVWRQRGESHRRWLIDVMLFVTYDADKLIRNADFISIARRAIRHPLNQPAKGRPNPLNLLNPGRSAAP